jgi:hypothetical protein
MAKVQPMVLLHSRQHSFEVPAPGTNVNRPEMSERSMEVPYLIAQGSTGAGGEMVAVAIAVKVCQMKGFS